MKPPIAPQLEQGQMAKYEEDLKIYIIEKQPMKFQNLSFLLVLVNLYFYTNTVKEILDRLEAKFCKKSDTYVRGCINIIVSHF